MPENWKKKKGYSKINKPMMAPALVHFNDSDKEVEMEHPSAGDAVVFLKLLVTSRGYLFSQSINKLKLG